MSETGHGLPIVYPQTLLIYRQLDNKELKGEPKSFQFHFNQAFFFVGFFWFNYCQFRCGLMCLNVFLFCLFINAHPLPLHLKKKKKQSKNNHSPPLSPQVYVNDEDTKKNSFHSFYQQGKLEPSSEILKGWSKEQKPDPIKVEVNGSVVTNFKFPENINGQFKLRIKANDSAGSDFLDLDVSST